MKRPAVALSALVVGVLVSSCAVGVRQPATNITDTGATLNGTVLSTTGGPGSYFIEYGLTQARSEKTPTRAITFTANTIYPVSEPVEGLDPGRLYHFAVCAEDSENPGDPFCSPDQTFETPFDPQTDYVSWRTESEQCVMGHCATLVSTVVAISGPSGENPQGTYSLTSNGGTLFSGAVTCLRVSGNRAVVGLDTDLPDNEHVALHVEDGGNQDRFILVSASESLSTCPPFTSGTLTGTSATIIVHDAALSPSS